MVYERWSNVPAVPVTEALGVVEMGKIFIH